MRKFIAAGIGSLTLAASVATMAVTTAAPASAAPIIPVLCTTVPAMIATANGALTAANGALGLANGTMSVKQSALDTALTNYVAAAVSYLQAVDAGSGVALAKSILDARTADVGTKAAEWSAARVGVYNAQGDVIAAQINVTALTGLLSGLCS